MKEKNYDFDLFTNGKGEKMVASEKQEQTVMKIPQANKPDENAWRTTVQAVSRRKKQMPYRNLLIVALSAVLVAVIVLFISLFKGSYGKTELYGTWSIDGVTKYEFIDDTKGALILPHNEYIFTYTIDENKISIDYVDSHLIDSEYEFTLTKDKLIFKNEVAEYVMKREK